MLTNGPRHSPIARAKRSGERICTVSRADVADFILKAARGRRFVRKVPVSVPRRGAAVDASAHSAGTYRRPRRRPLRAPAPPGLPYAAVRAFLAAARLRRLRLVPPSRLAVACALFAACCPVVRAVPLSAAAGTQSRKPATALPGSACCDRFFSSVFVLTLLRTSCWPWRIATALAGDTGLAGPRSGLLGDGVDPAPSYHPRSAS